MALHENTVGRKRQDTPENIELLLKLIRNGCFFNDACAVVGIDYRTFCRWRQEDPEFCHAIKKARACGVIFHVQQIIKASEKDWRAAAWWLERASPERFSLRYIHSHPERRQINLVYVGDVTNGAAGPTIAKRE